MNKTGSKIIVKMRSDSIQWSIRANKHRGGNTIVALMRSHSGSDE